MNASWFSSWFDSPHYHALYAHRDAGEAAGFVDALIERLEPAPGAALLDLGCGAGRHAAHLASKGFQVTGLDLSAASVRAARRRQRPSLRFRRHDMRRPFGAAAFDGVFNMFTSFGYFTRPGEHLMVVHNIAASLKAGGTLVLDYLNVRHAEARLIPEEAVERGGIVYHVSRWIDADGFCKRIAFEDGGQPVEHVERVARFGLQDFQLMFALYGLRIEALYGDYRLAPFDEDASPRLVLIARKMAADADQDYLRDRFLRMRLTVSGETPRYDASMNCGTRCAIDGYVSMNSRYLSSAEELSAEAIR